MGASPPKKLSPAQRAFAENRVAFLGHQIRLLKLGKPGVNQVIRENRAEMEMLKTQLTLDDLADMPLPPLPPLPPEEKS